MKNYNRTLWENNKTVVDAEYLNNIEDQVQILTNATIENSQDLEIVKETLPMKANLHHTHDDLISNAEVISHINALKEELMLEFNKYYDNADIVGDTLNFYSNGILLNRLKLPSMQTPEVRQAICGLFLCGELNCDDYDYSPRSTMYEQTIWEDGVTPVNAHNLNKIENKLLDLSQKLQELSENGIDLADNFIHTGSAIPSTTKGIWIDNSDEEEMSLADPLIEQFAQALRKHQQQIDELFYLTDAYLDDGLFEDEDDETENLDGGIF